MSTTKPDETVVLFAQVEKEYETYRVVAHVYLRDASNEFRSATWDYGSGAARDYDGFAVHAYLGQSWGSGAVLDGEQGVWGLGYSYSPYRIDSAGQARAIARVMERLERGLDKLNNDEGYLGQNDYTGYLLRIARVLKIKQIWVRRTKRQYDMSGEPNRLVNGSALQCWVQEIDQAARAGKTGELIRS